MKQARMVKKGALYFVFVYGICFFGFPFGLFMALEDWGNTVEFISRILAAMLIGGTIFGSLMYISLNKGVRK
ncbi:hypothetical protein [Bacillus suaedae]|uniref:Uncharacterized protein n=1 Tax=Halalkalibacter suaedae TaxID=2822140 RepID=A0A940WW92_9BACI|nr:hypothetical protein [Bacillus suaedae]MBP3951752.1 hypothetical protein [Bacillus suaedae]